MGWAGLGFVCFAFCSGEGIDLVSSLRYLGTGSFELEISIGTTFMSGVGVCSSVCACMIDCALSWKANSG